MKNILNDLIFFCLGTGVWSRDQSLFATDYRNTNSPMSKRCLELLNRIEKDIDELRGRKTRDGFSEYVALAGLGAALFVLLAELKNITQISFSRIGLVFFGGLLLLKIPWALY